MRFHLLILPCLLLLAAACNTPTTAEKKLTQEEMLEQDSVSRAEQRLKADSMKERNPFLIMPPDSMYTGSYVDKYNNGIIKYTGFFRLGKRHGQWMSFYPNGLAWSEMHYDKGLREGPNITYYEGGKTRYSGYYKADRKDSIWCYYDSLGKMAERVLFNKDKVVKLLPLQ